MLAMNRLRPSLAFECVGRGPLLFETVASAAMAPNGNSRGSRFFDVSMRTTPAVKSTWAHVSGRISDRVRQPERATEHPLALSSHCRSSIGVAI